MDGIDKIAYLKKDWCEEDHFASKLLEGCSTTRIRRI